jgi:hypothetical protein
MQKTQLPTSPLGPPAWRSPASASARGRSAAVAGSPAQVDPILAVADLELTSQDIAEIEAAN